MTPSAQDITIDTSQIEKLQKNSSTSSSPKKKKRRNRPRKNSSSDSGSSTSSDSSNRKSPLPKRKRKNKKVSPCSPHQIEPTDEEKSRYVALDCEMVGVGHGGYKSSLARVCIIDWNGKTIMDSYVRQDEPVTDYRTFVSGITPEHLESDDALDLQECRNKAQQLLEGKILVGHALKNDLHALQITHPWYDTRDTGKYEPFMKVRFDDGVLWPRKLKDLAKEKLGKNIQTQGVAHSPYEDAKTAMDLYKLTRRKWEKAMEYKRNKTMEIEKLQQSFDGATHGLLLAQ